MALADLNDEQLRTALTEAIRRERVAILHWIRPLLPLAVGLGVVALVWSSGDTGELDFYRAAATIIPTLLLTLAVQGGFFRLNATVASPLDRALRSVSRETFAGAGFWNGVHTSLLFVVQAWPWGGAIRSRSSVVVLLLAIAGAEVAALYPLITGTASSAGLAVVCGGMSGAFIAIAMVALFGTPPERPATDAPDWVQILYEIGRRAQARDEADRERSSPEPPAPTAQTAAPLDQEPTHQPGPS